MRMFRVRVLWCAALVLAVCGFYANAQASPANNQPGISTVASTVPANGDVNPYGIAVVPSSAGSLVQGNILVSNFNDSANLQGTGTTIVQIAPSGAVSLFAQINAGSLPGLCRAAWA